MNYLDILIDVVNYIESDLKKSIDKDYISMKFGVSYETLSRVSSIYMDGITLTKYIQYRRLSEAANELLKTDKMVCEMAFEYGYKSSVAFSNAFKKYHGNSPLAVRNGALYKSFNFNNTNLCKYLNEKVVITIENIESYEVSSLKIGYYKDLIEKNVDFSSFWNVFIGDELNNFLLKDKDVYEIIDIDDNGDAIYYIAFEKLDKKLEEQLNMKPLKIKTTIYTVLSTNIKVGTKSIPNVLDYVLSCFLKEENKISPSKNRFLCAKQHSWGSKDFDIKYYIAME